MKLESLLSYFDKQINQPVRVPPSPLMEHPSVAANQTIFEARPGDKRLHYFIYKKDNSRMIESVWLSELKDLAPKVKSASYPPSHSNVPYLTLC